MNNEKKVDKLNVLVTGAAGLYGVHLVSELLQDPDVSKVVGVDDFSRQFLSSDPFIKTEGFNEKFHFEQRNSRDLTVKEINEWSIDTVVHLAASVSIPESMESIEKQNMYMENNVYSTLKLLQTLLQTNKHPFLIYASSPEVYGNPEYTPMDEKHPMNPCSVYAATKVAAEKFICSYQNWFNYPAAIVRNFNTFGPNQNIYEDAAVTANFIFKALKNEPIVIHGNGDQTRDFQYVEDAIHAYTLINKRGNGLAGSTFNIGTGKQTSINELAITIKDVIGSSSEIKHTDKRLADLVALEADCSIIKEKIGWQPNYTLRQGLEKSVSWYENVLKNSEPVLRRG